ncbi:MAG: hypothetical protein KGJ86_12105 [Chloroflexota bacterium]|nr:hypothetical protein [Chloroflexota bacterium]
MASPGANSACSTVETGRSDLIEGISLEDGQAYLDYLRARQHKVLSIQTRARSLRAFFHWVDGRDDPRFKRLEVPRQKQAGIERVHILDPLEIAAIERSFNPRTFAGLRDRWACMMCSSLTKTT